MPKLNRSVTSPFVWFVWNYIRFIADKWFQQRRAYGTKSFFLIADVHYSGPIFSQTTSGLCWPVMTKMRMYTVLSQLEHASEKRKLHLSTDSNFSSYNFGRIQCMADILDCDQLSSLEHMHGSDIPMKVAHAMAIWQRQLDQMKNNREAVLRAAAVKDQRTHVVTHSIQTGLCVRQLHQLKTRFTKSYIEMGNCKVAMKNCKVSLRATVSLTGQLIASVPDTWLVICLLTPVKRSR